MLFLLALLVNLCFATSVLYADDPVEVIARLKEANGGVTPNDSDYFLLVKNPELKANANVLRRMIRDQQNALISVDKLLKLAEMKQKGIHRFKCHYSVIYENVIDPSANFEEKRKFAFDSNKLFLEKDTQMTDQSIYTRAYDGENCYSLLAYPSGHKHAGVLSAEDGQLQIFFPTFTPIALSMLFDTSKCAIASFVQGDLVLFLQQKNGLVFVCEKIEQVDGRECVVLTNMTSRIYLDIKRDYSVIMAEHFRQTVSDGALVSRCLTVKHMLYEFKDYGNGVWLPSRGVAEQFDDSGELTSRFVMHASLIEVNEKMDDEYFTSFIPDGTLVADAARGIAYQWGDQPSIDALLKETATSKRVWIFKYISMALGLAMIIFALVAKYLAYRKRKK